MKVLGVDVGGSGIKAAPVDTKKGQLLAERHRIETPRPATPKAIARVVGKLAKHFDWKGPIGVGFPAPIRGGVAKMASNIDDQWIGTNAVKAFEKATGCPTVVVNDADAAGLAEMAFGAGKGQKGLVLIVTLGTGVGSALFSDGVLVPNAELGHIILNDMPAEKYMADIVRKREGLKWSAWAKRVDEYLHRMVYLFHPDLIIIGGGVSRKHHKFLPYLTVETEVVPAQMLNEAGIIGAALAGKPAKK